MARMMGSNLKLVGRCHPWCGNRELLIGRAAEKYQWRKEITDMDDYTHSLLGELRPGMGPGPPQGVDHEQNGQDQALLGEDERWRPRRD